MIRHKSAAACLLAAALCVTLSACSSKSSKLQQEYKDLGISRLESGDYESALENFQSALDCSLGSVGAEEIDICYYKALAQIGLDDTDGALDTYTALIEYDDDNWEVYYLRGCAYLLEEDISSACGDFDEAAALNSSDIELYLNICLKLDDAGASDSAGTYLAAGTALSPSDAEDYANSGYLYYLAGDSDTAISYITQAIEKEYTQAYLVLGKIYMDQGSTDDALTAFESYLAAYPEDAQAYDEIGELLALSGDYASASDYFETALSLADDSSRQQIWKNLIASLEQNLDFSSALTQAKSYLEEYPDDEEIQKEYEFLQTR